MQHSKFANCVIGAKLADKFANVAGDKTLALAMLQTVWIFKQRVGLPYVERLLVRVARKEPHNI